MTSLAVCMFDCLHGPDSKHILAARFWQFTSHSSLIRISVAAVTLTAVRISIYDMLGRRLVVHEVNCAYQWNVWQALAAFVKLVWSSNKNHKKVLRKFKSGGPLTWVNDQVCLGECLQWMYDALPTLSSESSCGRGEWIQCMYDALPTPSSESKDSTRPHTSVALNLLYRSGCTNILHICAVCILWQWRFRVLEMRIVEYVLNY